jgi:uncharacterized membrane protein
MWFYSALGVSLITGLSAIISKHTLKTISPIAFFWAVLLISTPPVIIVSWKDGFPAINAAFFVGILASIAFYTVSKLLYYRTIKDAALSHVHPLVALGPIFTLLFSFLILTEKFTIVALVGICITILGAYVLNISSMKEGLFEPFKIIFRNKLSLIMLLSVIIGSIVTVFDKLALKNTLPENPNFALITENLFLIVGILPWILYNRSTHWPEFKNNFKWIFIFGILQAASNMLGFYSLSAANPGLVTSVFRAQIFFVLIFSYLFFGDRPKTETVVGSIIMIGGLVVLKLFS